MQSLKPEWVGSVFRVLSGFLLSYWTVGNRISNFGGGPSCPGMSSLPVTQSSRPSLLTFHPRIVTSYSDHDVLLVKLCLSRNTQRFAEEKLGVDFDAPFHY